jgi:hypothetical protein
LTPVPALLWRPLDPTSRRPNSLIVIGRYVLYYLLYLVALYSIVCFTAPHAAISVCWLSPLVKLTLLISSPQNNSGVESATDGGSSIHIIYEEYVPPTGITREINYNEASLTNIFDRPTRHRHLQQVPQTGMNVHVFHSTMTHGFKTNNATYRAVFSQGFVLFDNVTVAHNTGGLLTNVVGGTAIIQNSLFASNDMTAAIRVTEGGWIMVSNTNFVQNVGVVSATKLGETTKCDSIQAVFFQTKPCGLTRTSYHWLSS